MNKLLAVAVLLSIFGLSQVSAQNRTLNLNDTLEGEYEEIPIYLKSNSAFADKAKRLRELKINPNIQNSELMQVNDTILLDLFADIQYKALIEKISVDINGTTIIRARLADTDFGYCWISTYEGKSLVKIDVPESNESYTSAYDQATETYYLLQVDKAQEDILEGGPSLIPPADSLQKESPKKKQDTNVRSSGAVDNTITEGLEDGPIIPNDEFSQDTITLLIVYTPAAASWSSSNEISINNTISMLMDRAQLSLDNSSTLLTLELVHSAQVDYSEVNASVDLGNLRDPSDGDMDIVHSWRDAYAADVVVLLEYTNDVGGMGYLLNSLSGAPAYAFSLTRVQQAGTSYTTIHEIGHNMGCHHHKEQNFQPGPGIFSYSAGWRWTGTDSEYYCSVMTYTSGSYFVDGITHTRIAYFSNPDVSHQTVPTGDAADGDNAWTIRQTKGVISTYRTESNISNLTYLPAYNSLDVTGTTVNSSLRVENNGTEAVGEFYIDYYLSATTIISPGSDYSIGSDYISGLLAGGHSDESLNVDVSTVNPGIPDGSYYMYFMIDAQDMVIESSEADNDYLFLSPMVYVGTTDCPDSYEPNDDLPSAAVSAFSTLDNSNYNSSINGTIHDESDEDYYRINASVTGTLQLDLPAPPADFDLELLDESGQTVASSTTLGSESLTYEITDSETGYYYIYLYGYQGANSCTGYTLSLDWNPNPLDVTPDSRTVDPTAGSTTFNVSSSAAWDVSDDASWVNTSETNSTTLGVTYDANLTTSSRTANITVTADGGLSETVTLIQEANNCPDSYETNNTLPTATTSAFSTLGTNIYNSSVHGTVHDASDVDYFSLNITEAGTLTIQMPDPPADPDLELLNASGQQVAFSGTQGSETLNYQITVSTTGIYYIHVYGYDGASSCEEYSLHLGWIPDQLDVSPNSITIDYTGGVCSNCFDVSTNTAWEVNDDASWLTATASSETAISLDFSTNTSESSRTALITVTGVSGLTETTTVTQTGQPQYPNLLTYKPDGWEDGIIVSSVKGTYQNSDVYQGRISYIDFALTNNGTVNAGEHNSCIYLDSETIRCIEFSGFAVNYNFLISDWEYTFADSGWHKLQISADVDNDALESDESDNIYEIDVYVISTTDIENSGFSDKVNLYPNPSGGKFILEINNALGERYQVEIVDPTGKVIWNGHIENQGTHISESIDLSGSPAGLYFVKVHNKNFNSVKKLIIAESY